MLRMTRISQKMFPLEFYFSNTSFYYDFSSLTPLFLKSDADLKLKQALNDLHTITSSCCQHMTQSLNFYDTGVVFVLFFPPLALCVCVCLCESNTEVELGVLLSPTLWQLLAPLLMKINADECWTGWTAWVSDGKESRLSGADKPTRLLCIEMRDAVLGHGVLSWPPWPLGSCREEVDGGWSRAEVGPMKLTVKATHSPSVFLRDECWCFFDAAKLHPVSVSLRHCTFLLTSLTFASSCLSLYDFYFLSECC